MVAGMTPTTSEKGIPLVAAVAKAGYLCELAAGGLSRPAMFEKAIYDLMDASEPGTPIHLNLLYLNAKQWRFQLPLLISLRKAGAPIESVTIAAGIPTPDKAAVILSQLQAAGIRFVSFKPGSANAIRSVVALARTTTMPIVIQWTGGRGGGHHSCEDFHEPLLETYALIRSQPNVLLVVGSGFGDAAGIQPYLTGEWSKEYGRPSMPVDGILMGSRVMVALEAATADEVKELLVQTTGVEDERLWEQSYSADGVGGVLTVNSELGESIHKVKNRGMVLWQSYDRKYMNKKLSVEQRTKAIVDDRDEIKKELNADFQKPFFGVKLAAAGGVEPADLIEMTYYRVLARMVELMFVPANGNTPWVYSRPERWLHPTYLSRVQKFLIRAIERVGVQAGGRDEGGTRDQHVLQDIAEISQLLKTHPTAALAR
jgi:fatty acid synthase subunit beta